MIQARVAWSYTGALLLMSEMTLQAIGGARARQLIKRNQHMCLRLIDSCITQLQDQEPSRTCNEGKEEEADETEQTGYERGTWS